MHIGWSFLDKYRAAREALEAREDMHFIVEHTPEAVESVRNDMASASALSYSDMPHVHNPKSGEDKLLAGIDRIDFLNERYRQALEYIDWFEPAWDQLSEDDRYVLETFFVNKTSDAAGDISEHFHIERSSAYSRRKRALGKLAILLYGKF